MAGHWSHAHSGGRALFFTDSVPCAAGAAYNISLTNNRELCDVVPPCMGNRVNSTQGTGLIPGDGTGSPTGVYCASSPPVCLPQEGCSCASRAPKPMPDVHSFPAPAVERRCLDCHYARAVAYLGFSLNPTLCGLQTMF